MSRLHSRGLARPGPFGIGVDTDLGGRVVGASGQPTDWLWAVGSLRQGQLFECTAVPEIRVQARNTIAHVQRRARQHGDDVVFEGAPLAANY